MARPYTPPTWRLSSDRRTFEEVVKDIRYTVFSVVRLRPTAQADIYEKPVCLGSGFFVSNTLFMTCHHVVNPITLPHQDGDFYWLVSNFTGSRGTVHQLADLRVGVNLFLHPDSDLALIRCTLNQPYVALNFGDVPEGREIGVAGYPLARLDVANNDVTYDGMIFRVARGVVGASYPTTLNNSHCSLVNVPVVEVNFMFVPGNSGGPVFDAQTGRVFGFVQGFNTFKIIERVQTVQLVNPLPAGVGPQYIENLSALYSVAIRMERVRPFLAAQGVTL